MEGERRALLPGGRTRKRLRPWILASTAFAGAALFAGSRAVPGLHSTGKSFESLASSEMQRQEHLGRIHVNAETGDDSSGDGSSKHPLATIYAAQSAARKWRSAAGTNGHVTICLENQVHYLATNEPFSLGPEDSYTTIESCDSQNRAWISGGFPLGGWTESPSRSFPGRPAYTLQLPREIYSTYDNPDEPLKSLRVGSSLETQLRYPSRSGDAADYTTGYLFVNESFYDESNGYMEFWLTVNDENLLPDWIRDPAWPGAFISLLPDAVWLNYFAPVSLASDAEKIKLNMTTASLLLKVKCPTLEYHACHSSSTKAISGNAFWLWGGPGIAPAVNEEDAFLSTANPWIYDDGEIVMWPRDGRAPANGTVVVPTMEAVVKIQGVLGVDAVPDSSDNWVQHVSLRTLGVLDTHFSDRGFQDSFNVYTESGGIPHSTAVRISGAKDIMVSDCRFESLAGGGVSIAYGSRRVKVENSTFSRLGQSGVMLIGNKTTQPTNCAVVDNHIEHVGMILFSAAGVYVSTGSDIAIVSNDISYSSRWGIAVRSEETSYSPSYRNLIALNRVYHTGLATSDLGAISVISWLGGPNVNTTIEYNCVRDVVGLSTDDGMIRSPYNARGLYLDNEASGYTVRGNVFRNMATTGFFIHSGGNNTIENNIVFNATLVDDDGYGGQWSFSHYWGSWLNRSVHNVVNRNIVAYPDTGRSSAGGAVGCPSWGRCTSDLTFDSVDQNLYFQFGVNSSAWQKLSELTPLGDWAAWQAAGYDTNSLFADPLFNDVESDLCLQDDSPAFDLGFEQPPTRACRC